MIFVSHALPVNEAGQPTLRREDVWNGLVLKADNALPFVAVISECQVTNRHSDTVFDRDIVLRGRHHTERVSLQPPNRIVFTRLAGPVLGTITNEIEGDDDDLKLRFSFALVPAGVEPGSVQERDHADGMRRDYLLAVISTLAAIRAVATSG